MKIMKKVMMTSVMVSMLLSGCGLGMDVSGKETEAEASAGVFGNHSSYFDQYHCEKNANICNVSGIIHQEDDQNGILTYLTTEAENGGVTVTGRMNCTEGSVRLIYLSPDGTEALIADGTDLKIDRQISVGKGESSIRFAGDGQSAVCEFVIRIEVGDGVTFGYGEEKLEDIKVLEIKEVENSWPEKISYQADGVHGNPISTVMEIEYPVTLSIVCETLDGELKLKIADQDGKEVFEMDHPDGTYTVEVEKAGTYQVLFYAKEHVGSVEITPVEE